MIEHTVRQGGIQPRHLGGRRVHLLGEIPQVVIETELARSVVVPLHRGELADADRVPVRRHDGAERVREGLQLGAVHQRDRPVGTAGHAAVVVVELLAIRQQVRLLAAEHVPGKGLVDHPVLHHLRRGEDHVPADVLEVPGHLDRTHQAGIQDQVVQFHRQGIHEVGEFHPIGPAVRTGRRGPGAEGLGRGPCRIALRHTFADARSFAVGSVSARDPAGAVGRGDHPVVVRREQFHDIRQSRLQGLLRRGNRHIVIGLEGIGDRLAFGAAVDADEPRRVGRAVVALRGVDEGHDRLVLPQTGQDPLLDLGKILHQVGTQVVVAQAAVDEHLVIRPLERTIQAAASRHQQERECRKYGQ